MCYKYFVAILIATIASASQELPAFDGLSKSPPGDAPLGIGALFPQFSLPSNVPTPDVPEPHQTFQEDSPQKLQPLYSPEKKQNFEQPVGDYKLFPTSLLDNQAPVLQAPKQLQTLQEDSEGFRSLGSKFEQPQLSRDWKYLGLSENYEQPKIIKEPEILTQPLGFEQSKTSQQGENFPNLRPYVSETYELPKIYPLLGTPELQKNFLQPVGEKQPQIPRERSDDLIFGNLDQFSFPQKPSGVITPLLPVNVISNLENIPEPLVIEQPQIPKQPLGNLMLGSLDEVSLAEKQDAFIPKNIIAPSLIIPEAIEGSLSLANVVSPHSSFPVTVGNDLPPTPSFAFPDTKVPNIPLIPQDLPEEKTHDEPLKVFPSIQDSESPLIPPDLFSDYDNEDDDIGMGVYDDKTGGDGNDDKDTGKGKGDDEGKDAADYSLSNKVSKDEGNGHDGDVGSEETSHGYGEDRGDGLGSSYEERSVDDKLRGDVQSSSGGDSGGLKPPLPDFIFRPRCAKRSRGVRKHASRYRKNRRGVRKHARRYRKHRRGVRKHARRYRKHRRGRPRCRPSSGDHCRRCCCQCVRKDVLRCRKHRSGPPRCWPSSGGHCRRCCCPCRCCRR